MAKYDRGTARKIGQVMREYQEADRGIGRPQQHLARNRRQAIAMALAEVRQEGNSAPDRGRAEA